jgi:dTDP-4-dehydrorhamnose reductase
MVQALDAGMRVLVTGARGQLGRALTCLLEARLAWAGDREELDITDRDAVERLVREVRPDVVVNAAADVRVDAAESETLSVLAVNAAGPRHLADAARAVGAVLVHISTDYVFDGDSIRPYLEEDTPRPLGAYGVSKLAGEQLVASSGCEWMTIRTSGLFGPGGNQAKGGSFVERILARARAGEALRVVDDQVFSPTYAPDFARGLVALVGATARGIVHLTSSGECSWHAFACAALSAAGLDQRVERIRTSELDLLARRPRYSTLSNTRYLSLGLPPLRPWSEALNELLRNDPTA